MSLKSLNQYRIILASQSPRRKQLLTSLKLNFETIIPDVEEEIKKGEKPIQFAKRVAKDKALKVSKLVEKSLIISADTIVLLDSKILGKPNNPAEAFEMLSLLSNKTHKVITGICVINQLNNKTLVDYEMTKVTFRKLKKHEIEEYIESGSPFDKAGSYGIQEDFGAVFVKKIEGCYFNVVGLPLYRTYKMLMKITNEKS